MVELGFFVWLGTAVSLARLQDRAWDALDAHAVADLRRVVFSTERRFLGCLAELVGSDFEDI